MPPSTLKLEQFRPSFSDDELAGLKDSLRHAKLPKATYASKQEKYGITHEWMVKAIDRWQNGFDWKKHEDAINEVDHYLTTLEDEGEEYKIHFIYHESKDPNAIPLMLLHGWPGSAFEFIDVVKNLRESTDPSFHLIVPMQPGYGWSSGPPLERGFGMRDCSRILHKLMVGLGFESGYAVQGGDVGSGLARFLAIDNASCKTIHLNYIPAVISEEERKTLPLSEQDKQSLERSDAFQATGRGYAVEHATRPGTIGIVVGSSPVALLAWLGEKFRDWTDDNLPLDQVLAIATVWWLRESFPSSIWPYAELLKTGISALHNDKNYYLEKPFGYSAFKMELSTTPGALLGKNGNAQFYRFHEKGGHFAGAERPEEFSQDMKDCFRKLWPLAQ
ncbi:hypothetical protein JCM10207_006637 [Rhodosporidiobolus poonsookiae]